jgi:hypothetical protein
MRNLRAAALGVLLAACTARDATGPGEGVVPRSVGTREVTCQAIVTSKSVSCSRPLTVPGQQVIGGQGIDVYLSSSNVSALAGVFHADVRVGNLSDVDLGTKGDGDTTGVYVFFVSGPTVTAGTGNVTLANADTTATFTAAGQQAFWYDTLLGPHLASDPKGWEWNYDAGVVSFTFTVLVAADVAEQGTSLHWAEVADLSAGPTGYFMAAAASSPTEALILTTENHVLRRTAMGWRKETLPAGIGGLARAAAAGPDRYYVAATSDLYLLDHGVWSYVRSWGGADGVSDISALGDTVVVAAGTTLLRFNGVTWDDATVAASVVGVAGGGVAVGESGLVHTWNGSGWVSYPVLGFPTSGSYVGRVWFVSSDLCCSLSMYAAVHRGLVPDDHSLLSYFENSVVGDPLLFHVVYDSVGTWDPVGYHFTDLEMVWYVNAGFSTIGWGTSSGGIELVNEPLYSMVDDSVGGFYAQRGDGTPGQYTPGVGVTSILPAGSIPANRAIRGVAANGASAVAFTRIPIGNTGGGDVLVWGGTTWDLETITANHLASAWVAAPNDMIVGGTDGLYAYDGSNWDLLDTNTVVGQDVKVVWGSGSTLFAWRSAELMRRQGGVWSSVATGLSIVPSRMGGSSPTDLYLGSISYELLRFNGTSVSPVTLPVTPLPASTQITAIASTGPNDLWVAAAGPGGASEVRLAWWNGVTWTTWLAGAVPIQRAGGIVIQGPGKALIGDKAGVFAVDAVAGTVRRAVSVAAGVTGERNFVAGANGEYWAVGQSGEFFHGTP